MDNRHQYFVYILTNPSRTLYIGVTNDLERRMYEHKHKLVPGFTSRYNITQLAYFEDSSDVIAVIAREKQLKGWTREKKVTLIKSLNPTWEDPSERWFEESSQPAISQARVPERNLVPWSASKDSSRRSPKARCLE